MKVDLIITNATVYTVDNAFSKGGKFLAIGTNQEILARYVSEMVRDYQGKK